VKSKKKINKKYSQQAYGDKNKKNGGEKKKILFSKTRR
jgi:hypothetical protein